MSASYLCTKKQSLKDLTDSEILAKVKKGDAAAFRIIVQMHEGRVATVVRNMLGNTPEVDDVGQEVFIRLFHSLEKFRGDARLSTYITRIAVNLSLNEIKRRKRKRWFSFSRENEKDWEMEDTSNQTKNYEDKEMIDKGLQQLKPEYRVVIVLRMIEGYSVKETAEMLGIPTGTVLSRQARGTQQLKDILQTKLSYRHGE